jgi:hypothetical protein
MTEDEIALQDHPCERCHKIIKAGKLRHYVGNQNSHGRGEMVCRVCYKYYSDKLLTELCNWPGTCLPWFFLTFIFSHLTLHFSEQLANTQSHTDWGQASVDVHGIQTELCNWPGMCMPWFFLTLTFSHLILHCSEQLANTWSHTDWGWASVDIHRIQNSVNVAQHKSSISNLMYFAPSRPEVVNECEKLTKRLSQLLRCFQLSKWLLGKCFLCLFPLPELCKDQEWMYPIPGLHLVLVILLILSHLHLHLLANMGVS